MSPSRTACAASAACPAWSAHHIVSSCRVSPNAVCEQYKSSPAASAASAACSSTTATTSLPSSSDSPYCIYCSNSQHISLNIYPKCAISPSPSAALWCSASPSINSTTSTQTAICY